MDKINILRNKVIRLGKFGFWMTALTILTSLLYQIDSQISIWNGDPGWLWGSSSAGWAKGFSSEDLNQPGQKAKKMLAAVNCTNFLINSAINLTFLFIFRAMWRGQAISPRTAILVMVLGILCILQMMIYIDVAPIPLNERYGEKIGSLTIAILLEPTWEIAIGLLAIAFSRVINFANIQKCQLEDIV